MIIADSVMMFTANVILSLVTVVSNISWAFILIMFIGMRAQGFFKAQQELAALNGFVESLFWPQCGD